MNTTWRQLERWLIGDNRTHDAGGLVTSIEANWAVSPLIACLAFLVAASIVIVVYWVEISSAGRIGKALLAATRISVLALIVLMLGGWTVQQHRTGQPDLVVVLDDSASMGLKDVYEDTSLVAQIKRRLRTIQLTDPTRLNLAKALLLENNARLMDELRQRYNVRFYLASNSVRSLAKASLNREEVETVTAEQPASRLGNCLREVLDMQRGRTTAAVVLLTDGVTTDGQSLADAAQYARRRMVPLFCVGLGSDRPPRDLRLTDLLTDEAAFVGDLLHFDVRLISEGFEGSATVRLRRSGESEILAAENVTLNNSGLPMPVRLTHRADSPGEAEYVVEVAPREGESDVENNRLTQRVVVRDATIRVLLVQAYPNYEFRFLKQVLLRELNTNQSAEEKVAGFRTVLQEADLEYGETDKTAERTFPASRDELFQYDVLIFGDVNPSLLSASIMNHICEFVTVRGGGVIFMSGPRYTPLAYRDTPLATLLPMRPDGVRLPDPDVPIIDSFRPRLTPLGMIHPGTQLADTPTANEKLWREELTPLRWLASVSDLLPGVQILAEHPSRRTEGGTALPVICLHFVGAGKVLFHATDETHRWRFRVGDVYFARYWVQTIRSLCRARLLAGSRTAELSSDREQYRQGDIVNLRVRFLDDRLAPEQNDAVTLVVERDGGPRYTVALHRRTSERGLFEGSASSLADGTYRAWVAAPTLTPQPPGCNFAIVAPPGELARTQMDAAELREAAKISGGKFYTFATANKLPFDLPRGRQMRIESLPPKPIWNSPVIAGLFITLLTAEWILRKRSGML